MSTSLWKPPCCSAIMNTVAKMDIAFHLTAIYVYGRRLATKRWSNKVQKEIQDLKEWSQNKKIEVGKKAKVKILMHAQSSM